MKTPEEFLTFSQANAEALMKSGQIMATGLQDMGRQFVATAQASMDETLSTVRAMAGVRSIKEAIDLQATLARSTIEKAIAQTGHAAEASFKLAEQAFAPLTARVNVAVESLGKPA